MIESLPPENNITGFSNWAATSLNMKIASDSSSFKCVKLYELIVSYFLFSANNNPILFALIHQLKVWMYLFLNLDF